MKQKEEQLSDAKKSLKALMTMPIHPDYKQLAKIPIPYHQGVLVKEINVGDRKIGSIIISNASNTLKTNEGIIYAVGPGCADYIKIGTKCQFAAETQQNPYTRYYVGDEEFLAVEFYLLLFAIPDPATVVYNGTKTPKAMGREKRMERQKHTFKIEREQAAADKDKRSHKTKGKIRPVK